MGKWKIAIGAVIGLFIVYFIASPYITVYRMKSAIESSDYETLFKYVDFPSVRKSLKDQIYASMTQEFLRDKDNKKDEDYFFMLFGHAFIGMMIDAFVTPENIANLMIGKKQMMHILQEEETTEDTFQNIWADASMSYESINRFVVKLKGDNNEKVKLVFRRQGLGWKLTEIIFLNPYLEN